MLHEVEQGRLKQREAALQLGMSERGLRKLLKRYRGQGDQRWCTGCGFGSRSAGWMEQTAARAAHLGAGAFPDLGPTLACEYLEEGAGVLWAYMER
jgi:hypothetical protein